MFDIILIRDSRDCSYILYFTSILANDPVSALPCYPALGKSAKPISFQGGGFRSVSCFTGALTGMDGYTVDLFAITIAMSNVHDKKIPSPLEISEMRLII